MNKIYAMMLAAMTTVAMAEPIGEITNLAQGGKARMELHDTPCTSEKALERVRTDARAFWKHGEYTGSDGKKIIACWTFNQGMIVLSDEEGDVGSIPAQYVKKLDNI